MGAFHCVRFIKRHDFLHRGPIGLTNITSPEYECSGWKLTKDRRVADVPYAHGVPPVDVAFGEERPSVGPGHLGVRGNQPWPLDTISVWTCPIVLSYHEWVVGDERSSQGCGNFGHFQRTVIAIGVAQLDGVEFLLSTGFVVDAEVTVSTNDLGARVAVTFQRIENSRIGRFPIAWCNDLPHPDRFMHLVRHHFVNCFCDSTMNCN